MNPYNLGWVWNFREIFFSRMPSSKNNFRAKVKVELSSSIYKPSSYLGLAISPEMQKMSFGTEMGKRLGVDTWEIENIESQIMSVERCQSQRRQMGDLV